MQTDAATQQARERVLEASLSLVSGRPRQEIATALFGALGALERARPTARDAELLRARDHLLESAMWLAGGAARGDVAQALLFAMEAVDAPAPERARAVAEGDSSDDAAAAELWRYRLEAWRSTGGAAPLTHLTDRVLTAAAASVRPLSPDRASAAFRARPAGDETLGWPLLLEVENGATRTRIPPADFGSIEQDVRWISGPGEALGVVGGRPFRVTGDLVYGSRAVRYVWIREEVLLPFGGVRLVLEGP